ncbi:hypothetical protein MKS88_000505 [Plasmodium brasilianum]|uniref:Uncharacterized protein n=2 Tax=Plasmodium (Plasmodium) TaxID=418103 RepID=A0A1A8VRK8_PLAMA|nr:conserved Plasmodium protein, unknown function [Plasmodium malariae]KAI4841266.1 hypothetical protein MKS88_000505 [Plasmodium brasilianum]SBS81446.1 conserved Plasmodium protein, unknown function [Plasmodium malariae]SBT86956.1 conserved Plasmodium protein, unknown function [Plasmodium malariae]
MSKILSRRIICLNVLALMLLQRNLFCLKLKNKKNLINRFVIAKGMGKYNFIYSSSVVSKKRNNHLYDFERSVDKVTGHFMKDKELFLEVDKKQKIIEEIEKMKILEYDHVKNYLDTLSENDVYEEVINHKIYLYRKNNEKEKQNNLIKVQNFLNPYIIGLRKKKAKEKVEYLIASMLKGDNIDQIITDMFNKRLIDVYLLTFIDDKIMEAHTKLVKNDKINFNTNNYNKEEEDISISEKILRTLKDRIIAQQKLNKKGTYDFTRILFLSTTLDIEEDRAPIIKSIIRSIEQLEEFELYLLDALEYAEENEKMKKYVPHLDLLLNTCKKINPIYSQLLNKQSENVRFFPDNVDLSQLKDL